ncbi:ATP-binding cassette domain-containing protein [Halobacteriovorax sp. XZX-3]|uniref:ABC transporter ATP-binding protein n=1 Tax=unclassified Halobacteriovorax TaxID=2639665 RepID=UPI000CCFE2A1|nr:ATP-binding cassette domain-containing protein [Halobacteriovorax sp. DA5]POB13993.1 ABC transporter ATP-binding protein [Halobacteriovorax sp. DA5]
MLHFEDSSVKIFNLTKTFGKHTVLNDLSFDIQRGSITTILGFSGAGKSTLLKHILGLHHPTSGKIEVLGKDLSLLEEDELRKFRQNYGMLFQYAALFDSKTTFENVSFPLEEFTKMTPKEIEEKVFGLLKSVGLQEISFDKLPSELSGGMRKRVGLARALALSPQVMLYDEPTTGLDPITTKMVNDLIVDTSHKHKDIGLTSIIISHDVKATLEISDYVAFLNRGNIVEYLPAKEFRNSKHPLVQEFINL